jgi:hypothetical protein
MNYSGIYTAKKEYANKMANKLPVHFGCLYAWECNRFVQCLLYSDALLFYSVYYGVSVIPLQEGARHERPILSRRNIKRTLESGLVRRLAS